MDLSRFVITLAVLVVGIGLVRFVLLTAGQAGDRMAALFVPPDRALGWPRGVQESDEPWGWRTGPPGLDVSDATGREDGPQVEAEPIESEPLVTEPFATEHSSGPYVVSSRPVVPVKIRNPPH